MGAFEVVADRFLSGRWQCVHHVADPSLATANGLAFRHPGCRLNLGRHALDLLDTTIVVTGIDHGLLFGHRRLVLLLRHADRTDAATVEELADHRFIAGQQHLAGAEHHQVLAEQHAHVVGHRAGDVDVVRDDQDRAVDLSVDVDQQLRQVRGTDRAARFRSVFDSGVVVMAHSSRCLVLGQLRIYDVYSNVHIVAAPVNASASQKLMTEKPDDEDIAVAALPFMTEEYLRFPTRDGAQHAVRQIISLLVSAYPARVDVCVRHGKATEGCRHRPLNRRTT